MSSAVRPSRSVFSSVLCLVRNHAVCGPSIPLWAVIIMLSAAALPRCPVRGINSRRKKKSTKPRRRNIPNRNYAANVEPPLCKIRGVRINKQVQGRCGAIAPYLRRTRDAVPSPGKQHLHRTCGGLRTPASRVVCRIQGSIAQVCYFGSPGRRGSAPPERRNIQPAGSTSRVERRP